MSDNHRFSYTPIVVGIVIALLGILTGLYIADNARQQLALMAASEGRGQDSLESQQLDPHAATPMFPDTAYIDEPLPDVVIDVPLPDTATTEILPGDTTKELRTDVPAAPTRKADEISDIQIDDNPTEADDFEEVPLHELE